MWAAACGATVAVAAWGVPTALGRTRPATAELARAERACREARERGAADHAAVALAEAERLLREARLDHRRQELRLYPLRNFPPVRARLAAAEAAGNAAAREAERERREDEAATERMIARAACAVGRTDELLAGLRLGPATLGRLADARRRRDEARVLAEAGRTAEARAGAESALRDARVARLAVAADLERFADPAAVERWRTHRRETIAWSARTHGPAVVVNKDRRTLTLYEGGRTTAVHEIELGGDPVRRKSSRGDEATPEGRYRVRRKRGPGETTYYLALELDYPNADDLARGGRARDLGGLIEIHGEGGRGRDWTRGCIALPNGAMRALYDRVATGTPVTIIGGDGTGGRISELARLLTDGSFEDACGPDR